MSEDDRPPGTPAKPDPTVSQARRVALAFQSVFGQQVRRSSDQRIVVEHLRGMCGRDTPIFVADKIGNYDPLRAAHKDGAQTQYLIIKRQLAIARRLADNDKPRVRVKRSGK